MQTELIYRIPGQNFHGTRARNLVASLARDGVGLPDALFHYRDGRPETGRAELPISDMERQRRAFPLVRFYGGHETVRLIGVGRPAALLVEECAMRIRAGLARICGIAPTLEIQSQPCTLERSSYFRAYDLASMLVTKKTTQYKALIADGDDGATARCKETIERAIRLQADVLMLDLPDDFEVQVDPGYGIENTFRVAVLDDATMQAAGHTHPKDVALGYRRLRFHTNLKLSGAWAAGYLISRGFGRIQTSSRLRAMREAA